MSLLRLPPLGLYIHIPWCQRKCPYCDFNSHTAAAALPEDAYVAVLLQDLENDLPLAHGRELQTIFIGGGTPSLFSARTIAALLNGVAARIAIAADAEITLEANPGSAEIEKFSAFRAAGINRLSLGIQSFDDELLLALGRVHDSQQALAAIEMAASSGLRSFNLDLMHGLPGQDTASARNDLRLACASRAPHISWYQLTIEPNTEFFKRPPTLPAELVLANIQDQGESLLASALYTPYEVSAYAQSGQQCQHNLNYWRFGDYLGIGAGAHAKLSAADGSVRRFAKRRQPDQYLGANRDGFIATRQTLSPDDLRGEFMLNALRLHEGFDIGLFETTTGIDAVEIAPQLDALQARGLLEVVGRQVRASALGRRFLDTVVGEFF